MAIECDPTALAEASACYCFDKRTSDAIKVYLLAVIAGLEDTDPEELADAAACYSFSQETTNRVIAYLLCQAANAAEA